MIAIAPKIGTTGLSGASSTPVAFRADDIATAPFSAVLQKAEPLLGELLGEDQSSLAENQPAFAKLDSMSGSINRFGHEIESLNLKTTDSKTSTSKTADSKATVSKTSDTQDGGATISPVIQDRMNPLGAAAPLLPPVLSLQPEMDDVLSGEISQGFGAGAAPASNVATPGVSEVGDASKLSPMGSNNAVLARPQENARFQSVPETEKASAAEKSVREKSTSVGTSDAVAVAGLDTGKTGTASPGSQPQPGKMAAAAPVHNASRSASGSADEVKNQAAIKSEIEKALSPLSVLPMAASPISSVSKVEDVSSRQTQAVPTTDSSTVSQTPANFANVGRTVDASSGTKSDAHKDDSASSGNSQTADQTLAGLSVKPPDSAPVFSLVGVQTPPAPWDSKSVATSVPRETGNASAEQLEQKSTGVTQPQAQGENASPYPTSLVHSAKLLERIGESELRLGIRAGEFGSVDIRTSMVRNQFTAEISVERGELGRVMAAELPGLQNRLAEQRVPVGNITLQNHAGSQSSASEQQKPREGQPAYATNSLNAREENRIPAMVARETSALESRLDVHI